MKKLLLLMVFLSFLGSALAKQSKELKYYFDAINNEALYAYEAKIELAQQGKAKAEELQDYPAILLFNNIIGKNFYYKGEIDTSLVVLNKTLTLIDSFKIYDLQAETYYELARAYINGGEFVKSYATILLALESFEDAKDYRGLTNCYLIISQIFYNVNDYDRCLEYSVKTEKLAQMREDNHAYIRALHQQGEVYVRIGKYEQASDIYRKCIAYKDEYPALYKRTIMLISKLQMSIGLYDAALSHSKRALELALAGNDLILSATIYTDIGYIYKLQGDFEKALEYNLEALKVRRQTQKINLVSSSLRNIGLLYLDYKKYPEAEKYFLEALEIGAKHGKHEVVLSANKYLGRLFAEQNESEIALRYITRYATLKDSLNSYFIGARMANMQRQYDLSRMETENEILKQRNQITELLLSRQNTERRFIVVGLLLVMVIALMLLNLYRLKKKHAVHLENKVQQRTHALMKEIEERKKVDKNLKELLHEKEILLQEIHHRVKNNMQVISSMIGMQLKSLDNPEFKEIFEQTQNRVRSLSLIHEKLYRSVNLADVDMKAYVETLVFGLFENSDLDQSLVKLEIDVDDISMDVNLAIPCGQIINELVTNIIKHAFPNNMKGEVYIAFRLDSDQYYLEVTDTGIGMPKNIDFTMNETLGMTLVNALSKQLHADVNFDLEIGTRTVLKFNAKSKRKVITSST